jgi:hypothetical protein
MGGGVLTLPDIRWDADGNCQTGAAPAVAAAWQQRLILAARWHEANVYLAAFQLDVPESLPGFYGVHAPSELKDCEAVPEKPVAMFYGEVRCGTPHARRPLTVPVEAGGVGRPADGHRPVFRQLIPGPHDHCAVGQRSSRGSGRRDAASRPHLRDVMSPVPGDGRMASLQVRRPVRRTCKADPVRDRGVPAWRRDLIELSVEQIASSGPPCRTALHPTSAGMPADDQRDVANCQLSSASRSPHARLRMAPRMSVSLPGQHVGHGV